MSYCGIFSRLPERSESQRKVSRDLSPQGDSISEMCRFFSVSRSGCYGYVNRMEKPAKDRLLAERIRECQERVKAPMATEEYIFGRRGKVSNTILKRFSE